MSMMKFGRITILLALALAIFLVAGCEEEATVLDVERSAASYLSEGWNMFTAGRYNDAIVPFNQAVNREPQEPSGYNGLGWSWAKIGVLSASYENFTEAIALGMDSADPYAGLAVCLRDIEPVDFDAVIEAANTALTMAPQYQMSRHKSMNWQDLRLILAQAYFDKGMYVEANAEVVLLDGTAYPVADGELPIDLALEIQRLGSLFTN